MNALTPNRALALTIVIGIYIFYNYGLDDGIFPFIILSAVLMGYVFYFTSSYKVNDEIFAQNTVKVEFKTGAILINGKQYKADQVTGMNIVRKGNIRVEVSIEMDDIRHPVQKVAFMTYGMAEKFMQRFASALRKANGPDLR